MSKLKKTVKAGLIAGVCGIGICALARKFKLTSRIADFAHSIEGVPFPGVNLYAFLAAKQMRPLYAQIAREIVSAGHFEHILDLNTNVGYLPMEIAQLDPETHVIGIDRTQDMVRIAQANAKAEHITRNVEYGTGEPTNLPFPGRYFDLVLSVNALHHWPDPFAVFDEVYHVLKPGGQLWLYDYRCDVPENVWEETQSKLPFYLSVPFMVGPMASWKRAYSDEWLMDFLRRTRFEDFKIERRTFTIFGRELPVFNRITLRKPLQSREE